MSRSGPVSEPNPPDLAEVLLGKVWPLP